MAVWKKIRPENVRPSPLQVTDAGASCSICLEEACEEEGGVPEASRTPGKRAVVRFVAAGGGEPGLYVWREGGSIVCVCGIVGDARAQRAGHPPLE